VCKTSRYKTSTREDLAKGFSCVKTRLSVSVAKSNGQKTLFNKRVCIKNALFADQDINMDFQVTWSIMADNAHTRSKFLDLLNSFIQT
jgi:hypothetical protein